MPIHVHVRTDAGTLVMIFVERVRNDTKEFSVVLVGREDFVLLRRGSARRRVLVRFVSLGARADGAVTHVRIEVSAWIVLTDRATEVAISRTV